MFSFPMGPVTSHTESLLIPCIGRGVVTICSNRYDALGITIV